MDKALHDDRMRLKMERPFMRAIAREKNRFTRDANQSFLVYGRVGDSVIEQHRDNLRDLFIKRYRLTIKLFGNDMRNLKSINKIIETKQDEERTFETILQAYLAAYGLGSVNQVAGTSLNDFRAFALTTYGQGYSTQEIQRMLRGQFGINAWRSATIARTEVGKIASWTQKSMVERASRETGAVFLKKWVPFLDDRTRISHAGMESHKAIPMESQFSVGGEKLDRPRDPNGSAGNIINCRCTLDFIEA